MVKLDHGVSMNKPMYQCAVCSAWFTSMEDYHDHEQEFHNPQEDADVTTESKGGPFGCPQCGVQFRTPAEIEDHLAEQHGDRRELGVNP
jgi:uncharacterized C2H2 Zn-finger protein